MIRKQARQRRDYLYRRALTLKDAETARKRAVLKSSLATGKPLDPSIANDTDLRKDFKYDESIADRTAENELDLDDEYAALSGIRDPRILVMTARDPSSRLRTFSKEVRLMLPTAVAPNRGNLILEDLVNSAQSSGFTDVVMLHEHRGTPTALTISHLPHGPTASFSLHNVLLRKEVAAVNGTDIGTVNEVYPHLIFEGFSTKLGERVVKILKHIFPPQSVSGRTPKDGRIVTFRNIEDAVEVRQHAFVRNGRQDVVLAEIGPRMTMRLFEVRSGTLAEKDGEKEWHLSSYTRTGRKKDYL
ncbi:MAG: hypothetical protein Q9159_003312 [Coniocarpon cinnabarinum]